MTAHLSESKSLSEMASRSRQSGTSATTNDNEVMVERIANQFGGDKTAAVQYLAYNSKAGQQIGSNVVDQSLNQTRNSVSTRASVSQFHADNIGTIGEAPTDNSMISQMRSIQNIDGQEQMIDREISGVQSNTSQGVHEGSNKVVEQKNLIQDRNNELETFFECEHQRTLIGKSVGKVGNNFGDLGKQIIKSFGDKE